MLKPFFIVLTESSDLQKFLSFFYRTANKETAGLKNPPLAKTGNGTNVSEPSLCRIYLLVHR